MAFREPLLLPALGLLAGIPLASAGGLTPAESLGIAALGLLAFHPSAWIKGIALTLLGVGIGALAQQSHPPKPRPRIPHAPNELIALEGCVVEPLVVFEGRAQFTVELQPGASAQATLYQERPPALVYGQRIAFQARLREPDRFRNPGSFDYPAYLERRGIYWTASLAARAPIQIKGTCGNAAGKLLSDTRRHLLGQIERVFAADPYRAGMMQALLLGDSQKVKKLWTEDFRHTGTIHALVISGQHVAVLAGVVVFALDKVLRQRMLAFAVSVVLAWVYALMAGFTAPVVRAAAGLSLFLLARYTYREGRVLNVLAGVVVLFVLADPGQVVEASFHLSFLAVAAIGGLAAPVLDRYVKPYAYGLRALAEPDRDLTLAPGVQAMRVELRLMAETFALWTRAPARAWLMLIGALGGIMLVAAESLMLSALVQVALALPTVIYFHRFPVTALSANLLIVPLLSAAVPLGFAAALTGWHWLAWIAGLFLECSRWIAAWHVPWEPAWRIPDPPWWLAVAFVGAVAWWMVALRHRRWAWAPALASVAGLAVMLAHPFAPRVTQGTLELTAIDVGQGDGLFLGLPDGAVVAVDAGGFPGFGRGGRLMERRAPRMDIGEDVISPYLWTRSLRRLDVIVLTHAHADHIGGLLALMENFTPRELWIGLMPPENPDWQAVRARALALGVAIRAPRAGEQWQFGGAAFQALAPFADAEPGPEPHNNDSLVLTVAHGRHRFLLTGDAEARLEGRMAAEWTGGRVDVLKVGHHGSRTSTSEALLDAFRPAFAVISCGRGNTFNHPHGRVVERISRRGVTLFRTDEQGLVTVQSDGRYLRWSTPGVGSGWLPALE